MLLFLKKVKAYVVLIGVGKKLWVSRGVFAVT